MHYQQLTLKKKTKKKNDLIDEEEDHEHVCGWMGCCGWRGGTDKDKSLGKLRFH
jgi:hypothetical protein